MVPEKDLTFLAFANSDAVSRGFGLGRGRIVRSPAGLIFLGKFVHDENRPGDPLGKRRAVPSTIVISNEIYLNVRRIPCF